MLLKLYTENPNRRDITHIADALANGQVVVIPTDTIYAFACSINFKKTVERIAALKGFTVKQAKYSLLCSNLSMASEYIRPLSKDYYQILRSTLPGPYTYILEASNSVPRHYTNADKTIGIRIPDNPICQAIIDALGAPLIATSVRYLDKDIDEEPEYITNPELIEESFGHKVDMVVDGGEGNTQPSTVVDLSGDEPVVLRQGKGEFEL